MDYLCPRCHVALRPERRAEGPFFLCDTCRGSAAILPTPPAAPASEPAAAPTPAPPERSSGGGRFVLQDAPMPERLACPSCAEPLVPTRMQALRGWREVDLCRRCGLAWFDAGELEALSVRPDPGSQPLSMKAREAVGRMALAKHKDSPIGVVETGSAEWLAGMFGVPTLPHDLDEDPRPWATWILCGVIVLLTLVQLFADPAAKRARIGTLSEVVVSSSEPSWADLAGFVPADPWRRDGLTFLTGFFLHAGVWHALANVYFLLLLGTVLEPVLGWWRVLLVILLSSFVGDLADLVVRAGSTIPSVGASGGIAGLFGLCAFAVPKLRLGFTLGTHWTPNLPRYAQLRLPVIWVFLVWMLGEAIALSGALDRRGWHHDAPLLRVAYHAHIAGALAGVGLFLLWRRLRGPTGTGPAGAGGPASAGPR